MTSLHNIQSRSAKYRDIFRTGEIRHRIVDGPLGCRNDNAVNPLHQHGAIDHVSKQWPSGNGAHRLARQTR